MKRTSSGRVRFGAFELDLTSGELQNNSSKLVLQEQPLQVLRMLIERRGKLISREEIRKELWPNDTIVEFDHSINAAIKNLRRALGDSADEPAYIETLPRRGYRLIVGVEWVATSGGIPQEPGEPPSKFQAQFNIIGKKVSHYRVLELVGGGGM